MKPCTSVPSEITATQSYVHIVSLSVTEQRVYSEVDSDMGVTEMEKTKSSLFNVTRVVVTLDYFS